MRGDGDDFGVRDHHWYESSLTFVPGRMADSCQIRKQPVGREDAGLVFQLSHWQLQD